MTGDFEFTFIKIKEHFRQALDCGYRIITCKEYIDHRRSNHIRKILVNRVDIDFSCKKAKRLAEIFNELNIRASFFVRLHAPEYNPFSFENYRCLKYIRDSGHEIGYHAELIDESVIWNEDAEICLTRDLQVLSSMLDLKICGVASHNGLSGLNNLDFWKDRKPSDFGLLYEAYDKSPEFDLFRNSRYVSDSNWTYWKCYENGIAKPGDNRSLGEHCCDGPPVIYSLIHSDTYYDDHYYE